MHTLQNEIPAEYQGREDVLVCDCNTWGYGCVAVLFFVSGLFWGIGVPILSLSTAMYVSERLSLIMLCIVGGIFILFLGWVWIQYIKNWAVIFHADGVWHRNLSGVIYSYTDAEIKGYIISNVGRYRYIILGTETKRVFINHTSRNYRPAKELVQRKYRKL